MVHTELGPEAWRRLKSLFWQAVELTPDLRHTFLAGCESDLRQPLQDLLAHYEESTALIRSGVISRERILEYFASGARAFEVGNVVAGRFRITRFIAEGGMGEVYEAEDRELGDLIALKTIRPALSFTPHSLAAFKGEIQLARRVTHNNVCRVFDVFWHSYDDGSSIAFLTMELLNGQTLSDYVAKHGPIPWNVAITLITQIVSALTCAHELDIIHRDLKPSNIMLVGAGSSGLRAVVTDFGLALSVSGRRHTAQPGGTGTPAYMAPEQVNGGVIGPQTDIYALGLIICDMLTGKHPQLSFVSKVEFETQLGSWLSQYAKLSSPSRRVIRRCLQFRSEDRLNSARQIVSALKGPRRAKIGWLVAGAGLVIACSIILFGAPNDAVVDARQVTPDSVLSGEPSLSPDGKFLVYMSNRADAANMDIWFQSLQNGDPRRLTNNPSEDSSPSISPDGKLAVFRSEREGGGIYMVHTETSGEELLAKSGRNPAFSPRGDSIAFWTGSDDVPSSGRLYVMHLANRKTERIALNFADARYPVWSPDARRILFEGCFSNERMLGGCSEWWVIDLNTGATLNTGILRLLRSKRIETAFASRPSWMWRNLIFSARSGRQYHIWDVTLGFPDLRVIGAPRQITSGDVEEMGTATGTDGTIAMDHVTGALHIWKIKDTRRKAIAIKVTDAPEIDCCPAVSRDQRSLFFTRRIGGARQLVRRDLDSGEEAIIYKSDEDKLWPMPSYNGDKLAFESRGVSGSSILLLDHGRVSTLCTTCSHPYTWIADGTQLVYADQHSNVAVLDVETKTSRVLLSDDHSWRFGDVDWNPENKYLLFTAQTDMAKRVFAAHLRQSNMQIDGPWIPMAPASEVVDRPRWSNSGNEIFYLSRNDGFYCLWGKKFDRALKTVGSAWPVVHYHDWRISPDRTFSSVLGVSVAGDTIYMNVGEVNSTIWTGRVKRDPVLSFFRQIF